VPQRLQDISSFSSDHFQHVGQQTFMTTAHSHQRRRGDMPTYVDGAGTVTGSAQCASSCAVRPIVTLRGKRLLGERRVEEQLFQVAALTPVAPE
jgi:hypothetical protein